MNKIYPLIRNLLFLIPAESSHSIALMMLSIFERIGLIRQRSYEDVNKKRIQSVIFKNKIGLAAGLDKNAEYINVFSKLGFGFLEVGTVTPKSQPGNIKPRLFRDVKNKALLNSFGFNNVGIKKFIENIKKSNRGVTLGINIGKNYFTPLKNAVDDYLEVMKKTYKYADYFTINISSPNTKNLRDLHTSQNLVKFLKKIDLERTRLLKIKKIIIPIFLKISPDISDENLKSLIKEAIRFNIDGLILTNTTVDKDEIDIKYQDYPGGVSGEPLKKKSEALLKKCKLISKNKLFLISVGGIMCPDDAEKRLKLGADLIQIYTGFIYSGPKLIHDIHKRISS